MKIHLGSGLTPSHLESSPDDQGWHRLERPTGARSQVLAAAIALVFFVVFVAAFKLGTPVPMRSLSLLAVFIPVIIVHELLHALVQPGWGVTERTYIGFHAKRLAFYAHFAGQRSRTRFIVGAIFPFVMLSILPLVACVLWQIDSPMLTSVSILNAILSCSDMITVAYLLRRCPRRSIVLTDQDKAWWKLAPA